MSFQYASSFFPSGVQMMQTWAPELLSTLYPVDLQAACPELEWQLLWPAAPPLRCPLLLPLAAWGIAIGSHGARRLQRTTPLLSHAWLFFALMNAAAICCHCLTPEGSPLKPLGRGLDVAFTCAACSCLTASTVTDASSCIPAIGGAGACAAALARFLARTRAVADTRAIRCAAALMVLVAVAANYLSTPWVNEVMYIGACAIAAPAVLLSEALRAAAAAAPTPALTTTLPQAPAAAAHRAWLLGVASHTWLLGAAAAAGLGAAGPLLDRHLCASLHGAPLHQMHLLFLGCNLAMLCLERHFLQCQPLRALPSGGACGRCKFE